MLTKIGFAPLILITLGLINLINAQNRNQVLSSTQTALQQISAGSEQFSLNLFKHLSAEVAAIDYDFIVSPFSVWSLLTLTAEGAEGNTYAELQNVLGLPNDLFYIREGYKNIQKAFKINTTTVELAVEQVLFSDLNRPVEYEFQDKLQRIYEADFQSVDFQQQKLTTERINNYIRQATRGRISKIVTREDVKNSQMMLLSAIYFKGQWKFPFNISATQSVPFYDENGNDIGTVNMMYNSGPYPYTNVPELNAFAVELPYGNEDRLSMIVLLPKKRSNLTNVIDQLPQLGMTNLLSKLRAAEALYANDETEVFLPRFRITSDFTLNLILNNMGINDIFSPLHVNLSKIRKLSDLYLSRIIHKAQIDVNEEGTVASAASGGSFINKMTPPTFYANRPFAYLIYEKTTNILVFCGQFPFNISQTVKEPFYNERGDRIGNVNMMKHTGAFPYVGILELGAFALELPYGNDNRLSMILLLPRKSSNLANVIENLPKYGLKQLMEQLRRAEDEYPDDEVDVAIPRFRIKADFILNVVLENMGLLDIFHPAYANLKRLTKNELFLSRIIHKAQIEVTEEGTVATAVTGGTFVNKSSPPKFIANRPFAYLIVEKSTQMLLFCGQVKNAPKLQF